MTRTSTALILNILLGGGVLAAQCTSQPPAFMEDGQPVAWPRIGWGVLEDTWWTVTSSGIKYVFCNALPPGSSNCAGLMADSAFTSSQKNAIRTAFTKWTDAKSANNSNLPFWEGFSTSGGDLLHIEVNRGSSSTMGADLGITDSYMYPTDSNGDSVYDTWRVGRASALLRDNIDGLKLTQVCLMRLVIRWLWMIVPIAI